MSPNSEAILEEMKSPEDLQHRRVINHFKKQSLIESLKDPRFDFEDHEKIIDDGEDNSAQKYFDDLDQEVDTIQRSSPGESGNKKDSKRTSTAGIQDSPL